MEKKLVVGKEYLVEFPSGWKCRAQYAGKFIKRGFQCDICGYDGAHEFVGLGFSFHIGTDCIRNCKISEVL